MFGKFLFKNEIIVYYDLLRLGLNFFKKMIIWIDDKKDVFIILNIFFWFKSKIKFKRCIKLKLEG